MTLNQGKPYLTYNTTIISFKIHINFISINTHTHLLYTLEKNYINLIIYFGHGLNSRFGVFIMYDL